MASRRIFAYDPSDYYYPTSYFHPHPYHHHHQPATARGAGGFFPFAGDADQYYGYQREPSFARSAGGFFPEAEELDPYYQPAPTRRAGGFFPEAEDVDPYYQPAPTRRAGGFFPAAWNFDPAAAREAALPKKAGASGSVSIPVRFVGSDPEEPEIARPPVKKRALSAEAAAVRVQAAARGFLARRAVRALLTVAGEAEEVAAKVAREADELRADARARIAVGEALMRLLLRLDSVRGAREFRRRVAKRVLALQDAVDALEQRPAPEAEVEAEEGPEAGSSTVEMAAAAEENAAAQEMPGAGETEESTAPETAVEMEVDDGDRAEAEDTEPAADDDAEGEWEMVADEPAAAPPFPAAPQAPQQEEPATEEMTRRPADADGGVDANKLMAMVAALCEQSAQQCAVIGALADRVDSLERSLRRVEDAERRRRRAKKLRKEGKGDSNHTVRCYSD